MFFAIVVLLTLIARRNNWKLYWLDGILFGVVSLVSLVLAYMWFGSDHWCTKENLNLLWANPLFIVLLLRLRHHNFIVTLIIACTLLVLQIGWNMWPQHFNSAILPVVLALMARLVDRFTDKNKYKI